MQPSYLGKRRMLNWIVVIIFIFLSIFRYFIYIWITRLIKKKKRCQSMTLFGKKLQKITNGNATTQRKYCWTSQGNLWRRIWKTAAGKMKNYQQQPKYYETEIGKQIEVINELKKSNEFTKSVLEDKVSKVEQALCINKQNTNTYTKHFRQVIQIPIKTFDTVNNQIYF